MDNNQWEERRDGIYSDIYGSGGAGSMGALATKPRLSGRLPPLTAPRQDIGTQVGTQGRNLVRALGNTQLSQFNEMRRADAQLLAPLASAGQAVGRNVENFGRALVGAKPVTGELGGSRLLPAAAKPTLTTPANTRGPASPLNIITPDMLPAHAAPTTYRTSDGRSASLPAGVTHTRDANGNSVFSNIADSTRGKTPVLTGAPPALRQPDVMPRPMDMPMTQVPRAPSVDPYPIRQADEERKAVLSRIDSELFRNSFAAGRGSKSARAYQSDLIGAMGQLAGQGGRMAAEVGTRNLDAAKDVGVQGMVQSGSNQRAVLEQNGANQRTGAQIAASQLQPNQLVQGPDGTTSVLRNDSSSFTLRDENGNPVKSAVNEKNTGQLTPRDLLAALSDQYKAEAGSMQPNSERLADLQGRMDALAGGGEAAKPSVGSVKSGFRFKGGDPAEASSWEQVN